MAVVVWWWCGVEELSPSSQCKHFFSSCSSCFCFLCFRFLRVPLVFVSSVFVFLLLFRRRIRRSCGGGGGNAGEGFEGGSVSEAVFQRVWGLLHRSGGLV
jgi:hypothetical protein